jgi:hypothetical protein
VHRTVRTVSSRDEAIVVGVDDGGVEDAVDVQQAAGLVQLVFDPRPTRNLNHCRDFGGEQNR